MRDPYPVHGRRRIWWAPWRSICRCGLGAYPCPAEPAARRVAAMYSDGLRYAQGWRDAERRHGGWR